MLAYVFWHRPREAAGYEAAVVDYHRALAEEAIEGFHGSSSHRAGGVPWLEGEPVYEDWYLLEAAWAIDPLGDAAVSGRMQGAHRRVAALTGAMTAGLYKLVEGEPVDAPHAAWFGRPVPKISGSLWRRQLVLGPTPEFCLLTPEAAPIEGATRLTRERIV
jgi:hypothetical protein